MQIDRISDMIAHFIGLFDTVIEEARLRSNYAEGTAHANQDRLSDDDAARLLDKNYDLQLQDYDPGVKYRAGYYDFDYLQPHFARMVEHDMQQLANAIPVDMSAAHFRFPAVSPLSKNANWWCTPAWLRYRPCHAGQHSSGRRLSEHDGRPQCGARHQFRDPAHRRVL